MKHSSLHISFLVMRTLELITARGLNTIFKRNDSFIWKALQRSLLYTWTHKYNQIIELEQGSCAFNYLFLSQALSEKMEQQERLVERGDLILCTALPHLLSLQFSSVLSLLQSWMWATLESSMSEMLEPQWNGYRDGIRRCLSIQ